MLGGGVITWYNLAPIMPPSNNQVNRSQIIAGSRPDLFVSLAARKPPSIAPVTIIIP